MNVFEDCESTKCVAIWYQLGAKTFDPSIFTLSNMLTSMIHERIKYEKKNDNSDACRAYTGCDRMLGKYICK